MFVAMMAECDLGDAVFGCKSIQGAAAQTRAQAAQGLAVGDDAFDHGIGVLLDDAESERPESWRYRGKTSAEKPGCF